LDPGSGIRDPGSGMGENQDPGSGINIPDPQHCEKPSFSSSLNSLLQLFDNLLKMYNYEFFLLASILVSDPENIGTRKVINGHSKKKLIGRACLCQNPKTKRSSGPENLGHRFKVGAAHT
jgi:hypothetical protein